MSRQKREQKTLAIGSDAMTDITDITKLDNYDAEDIGDVVFKLEKSFGLKFDKKTFINVKTFGDLCDIFEAQITYENHDDCTKQQAFYKIRKAISSTQKVNQSEINLESKLIDLFPKHDRRQKTREFQDYLGITVKILTYPDWLALTLSIGFLLSLIAFFFDWKIALSGIMIFLFAIKIAENLGKTLSVQTVRQLTEKTAKENYSDIRRTTKTVNRNEIVPTIIETFSCDLDIDKTSLTRDARFSST